MKPPAIDPNESAQQLLKPLHLPLLQRYALAFLSVGIALGVALLLQYFHFRDGAVPLLLFAVAITAWYAGGGAAVLAAVLSTIGFYWYFIEPVRTIYIYRSEIPYFLIFVAFASLISWFGTIRRRLELREAEERAELRRAEAYLAEAQTLTRTGCWVLDGRSHEILFWSEEMFRMYGFDPQQGPPRLDQARQRIHPEDRGKVKERDDKALLEKVDGEVEFRIILPDGTVKHIHALAHPVLKASGDVVEVVGTNVDITERKHAEEERQRLRADLAHSNRVSILGELAASISHELKQPIAATIMNANTSLRWLKRDQPDLGEVSQAAERIVNDGRRAAEIIDRLRSLYKKTPPQRELIDVNEIISEMVVLLRAEANRFGVSIRTEIAADVPKITADRVQLQQVLMNLMLNGIEAMKDTGGVLTVKSQPEGGQVVVSVSDTGVGLPTENADQIFKAFFTTKPQGSGMGLAISRSIVESHGGRLWATPNHGRGASFHFSLPTTAEASEALSAGT